MGEGKFEAPHRADPAAKTPNELSASNLTEHGVKA